MFFVRYKGEEKNTGKFTIDKIYVANEGFEFSDTIERENSFFVTDDADIEFDIRNDSPAFEKLDYVYGVWLGPPPEVANWEQGQVKKLDKIDKDGRFRVFGHRWFDAKLFEILDGTNLKPDMYVRNKVGIWDKIICIDNFEHICTENYNTMYPLTDFVFAVQDDGVVCIPIVVCNNPIGVNLTKGKCYQVLWSNAFNTTVIDDTGNETGYEPSRFLKLGEIPF